MALPSFFDTVARSIVQQPRRDTNELAGPNLIREAAARFRPRILVGEVSGASFDGIRLLAEMLARTYGSLSVEANSSELRSDLVRVAKVINPDIEITDTNPTVTFVWGEPHAGGESIWCGGDEWTAVVRRTGPSGAPGRFPGVVSATLAYGEGFKQAFNGLLPEGWSLSDDIHLSLLNYSTSLDHERGPAVVGADVGKVFLVGVGAIGMAFGVGLHALRCRARVTAIDNQPIDESNLQRYLTTTPESVGLRKPEWFRRAIQRTNLSVKSEVRTWERFLAEWRGPWQFERIVVGVDDAGVRRRIAAALPRVVYNGGVSSSVVTVGRYGFDGQRECLNCAYLHVPPPSLFEVMTQQFGIPFDRIQHLEDENKGFEPQDVAAIRARRGLDDIDARKLLGKVPRTAYAMLCGLVSPRSVPDLEGGIVPVAHVPILAGLLLANELAKACTPELVAFVLDHVFELDLKDKIDSRSQLTQVQLRDRECICTDPDYRSAYDHKWARR